MNRPIHFEFNSPNPETSKAFFETVFNWSMNAWQGPEEYWLVETGKEGPGINGGIMRSRDGQQRTVVTMNVESVDDTAKAVQDAGGQVVVPKMAIPGVGWLIYCTDPAGVLFGAMENDEKAK